jgi:hypothetical protein
MTYTPDALARLNDEFYRVTAKYLALLTEFVPFTQTHPTSDEYSFHGFMRRIGVLERCIQNIYSLYAPERSDIPSRETCLDLAINLQSFVFNQGVRPAASDFPATPRHSACGSIARGNTGGASCRDSGKLRQP